MSGSSMLDRLKRGLTKTRTGWVQRLESLFQNSWWDEEAFSALEEILISADVGVKATQKLVDAVRHQSPRETPGNSRDPSRCLQQEILRLLTPPENSPTKGRLLESPWVMVFLGVNGVGKTTTIGKMASKYRQEDKKVLLIAADTFRAAAIEQLEGWGKKADAEVIKHQAGADPSAVVFDGLHAAKKRRADVVMIDTAGRLHTKVHLIEELKKIRRVIAREQPGAPHQTLLVLDATTGQNALQQAKIFKEALEVTGIVLTKLDGTAKGGIVIGIQEELRIPVQYVGVGENVEDLQPFDPTLFVQSLFDNHM